MRQIVTGWLRTRRAGFGAAMLSLLGHLCILSLLMLLPHAERPPDPDSLSHASFVYLQQEADRSSADPDSPSSTSEAASLSPLLQDARDGASSVPRTQEESQVPDAHVPRNRSIQRKEPRESGIPGVRQSAMTPSSHSRETTDARSAERVSKETRVVRQRVEAAENEQRPVERPIVKQQPVERDWEPSSEVVTRAATRSTVTRPIVSGPSSEETIVRQETLRHDRVESRMMAEREASSRPVEIDQALRRAQADTHAVSLRTTAEQRIERHPGGRRAHVEFQPIESEPGTGPTKHVGVLRKGLVHGRPLDREAGVLTQAPEPGAAVAKHIDHETETRNIVIENSKGPGASQKIAKVVRPSSQPQAIVKEPLPESTRQGTSPSVEAPIQIRPRLKASPVAAEPFYPERSRYRSAALVQPEPEQRTVQQQDLDSRSASPFAPVLRPSKPPVIAHSPIRSRETRAERERRRTVVENISDQTPSPKHPPQSPPESIAQPRSVVAREQVETPLIQEARSAVERRLAETRPLDSHVKAARLSQRPPSQDSERPAEANGASWPIRARPETVRDDRWLAEALTKKYQQFKRYPFMARRRGWEGNVILAAVIKSDGNLEDLSVAESSGYRILDEDAIQTLKRVFPLHLEHPLGRSQIAVQLTIRYKLAPED